MSGASGGSESTTSSGGATVDSGNVSTVATVATSTSAVHDPWLKVLYWLFFSVIFAVLPIFAGFLIDTTRQTNRDFNDLISHGELYIVSAGLTAAAVGQSFMQKNNQHKFLHAITTFTNMGLFFLTSFLFADAVAPPSGDGSAEAHGATLAQMSLWFFGITLLTTATSTVLSEVRNP
ncbi:hypothetical protein [Streptomyces europaeiscabiei]|uniref:hypothetical protein n=1 Tax=Streptomyces europaeiscabiei TaxID=146819 RepID=UPI0038F7FD42